MSAAPIGYLVPEFPGQTHTWIWREFTWLERRGLDLRLLSTRPPPERDRARHAFAVDAAARTRYLHDRRPATQARLLGTLAAAGVAAPRMLRHAAGLAASLPLDEGPGWRHCLPLLAPAARLAAYCRSRGIAHVHCHTCGDGAIVAMLAHALGGTSYSLTINANLDWWGGAMEAKLGHAAFTISTMRWVKADVDARFPGAIAARCHYAPVGVDTEVWRPDQRRRSVPGGPLRLLCVGRLHPSKGFDIALRALRLVLDQGLDVRLCILGDGPERGRLGDLVDELCLGAHVELAGSVAESAVRQALIDADIFLLPSHAEPLGVVVMEAMAVGTPVIVTNAGGVAEIVTDGVDGLMIPPGEPPHLAQAVTALAGDPQHRAAFAAAGRRSVVERFDAGLGARVLADLLPGRRMPPDARQPLPSGRQHPAMAELLPDASRRIGRDLP